jgi:hypothetical protein
MNPFTHALEPPFIWRQRDFYILRLSDGEIWTAHGGVNPCGLVVRRGGV